LSLYPWLLFDHCTTWFRETVFVYDKVTEEGVVLREYPTNHEQTRNLTLPPALARLLS